MNKLSPEHLHLLLDEPIYILDNDLREHIEDDLQVPEKVAEKDVLIFKGENKRGILIIIEGTNGSAIDTEDEEFLFKGLNALNIFVEDVAIVLAGPDTGIPPNLEYTTRIIFSENPVKEKLYQLESAASISHLECHILSNIRQDKALKVNFWLGLKALFEQ